MKRFRCLAALLVLLFGGISQPSNAQTLPSEARGSAMSQIVMLSVNDTGCAAGIIVGYDDKSIYVATAAHILTDQSTTQASKVTARFLDVDQPRGGTFLPRLSAQANDDLAVVVVERDAPLNKYLDGLNFAMLSPKALVVNRPVTSIGCWGGTRWAMGADETLLSAGSMLRVNSPVNEGQSGGGLFSDSWELIGTPLVTGVNEISARPISAILSDLRSWGVPVLLRARALKDRVMGAEELAQRALRSNLSQRLASQSAAVRTTAPVRALLLGVEAVNQSRANGYPTPAAREALAASLAGISGIGIGGHTEAIEQSIFSLDERFLATASEDGLIRIWSLANSNAPKVTNVLGDTAGVAPDFIAFDEGSRLFLSVVYANQQQKGGVTVWSIGTPDMAPRPIATIISRVDDITAAVTSYDNRLLALAQTGRVLVHTMTDGSLRVVRTLSIPVDIRAARVAFSRDGKILLLGASDGRVVIWNLAASEDHPVSVFHTQHKQLGPFNETPDIDLLDISDDHSLLVTGSTDWSMNSGFADPNIRLWPLRDLVPTGTVRVLDQAADDANKAVRDAFLLDGSRTLVATTLGGRINLWDLALNPVGQSVRNEGLVASIKLEDHAGSVTKSADRKILAVAHGDVVTLARTENLSGNNSAAITLRGFDSSVRRVDMSRSGRFLFGAALGGSGRLWDLHRVDPLSSAGTMVETPYTGVIPVKLSATAHTIAVMRGSALEVWSISDPSRPILLNSIKSSSLATKDCLPCHIVLSDDDRWMVLQSEEDKDKSRVVEIAATGKSRRQFIVGSRTWTATKEIEFSPDGRWLFVDEPGRVLVAYDLRLAAPKRRVLSRGSYLTHTFSPDGKWLVLLTLGREESRDGNDGYLAPLDSVSDPTTWTPLKGFARGVGAVSFSRDGRWVAVAGDDDFQSRERDDRTVQLMRLVSGRWEKHADFEPIEYAASGLRISPNGQWLFTGGTDITLGDRNVSARVWDLNSPLVERAGQTLPGAIWNIKLAQFSPDSKWLITVSGAQSYASLWRLSNGRVELASKLFGPVPKLNHRWHAAFSDDSSKLVVWTIDDATPFFWDLADEVIPELGVAIPNGDRGIQALRFSENARSLIILNSGGTNTGTSGSAGAHVTVVDFDNFPGEDAYAALPAAAEAFEYHYREDLGLIMTLGKEGLIVSRTNLDREVERAEAVVGRNFTWEEWKKFPLRETYRPTFPDRPVTRDVIEAVSPMIAAFSTAGRKVEAERLLQNVIRWTRELGDGSACNSVAWDLAELGVLDTALELSQCALSASPKNPNYHDTYGVILAKLGRRDEAIREFSYFLNNIGGIERYQNMVPSRERWMELLRAGQDPFAAASN